MIIEAPNFVSDEDVEFILTHCRKAVKDGKGTLTGGYNRDGMTVDISDTPELAEVDEKLHFIMNNIQKNIVANRYNPQFTSADSGYDYHCYNPGDVCHFHVDMEVMYGFLRYASVIIHLTTNEEGGEIVFTSQNKSVKTEKGKVVIFPPYGMFGHYVTPSPTPREVIVSWFVYDGITVSKT